VVVVNIGVFLFGHKQIMAFTDLINLRRRQASSFGFKVNFRIDMNNEMNNSHDYSFEFENSSLRVMP